VVGVVGGAGGVREEAALHRACDPVVPVTVAVMLPPYRSLITQRPESLELTTIAAAIAAFASAENSAVSSTAGSTCARKQPDGLGDLLALNYVQQVEHGRAGASVRVERPIRFTADASLVARLRGPSDDLRPAVRE
jgi:hypothetical protein